MKVIPKKLFFLFFGYKWRGTKAWLRIHSWPQIFKTKTWLLLKGGLSPPVVISMPSKNGRAQRYPWAKGRAQWSFLETLMWSLRKKLIHVIYCKHGRLNFTEGNKLYVLQCPLNMTCVMKYRSTFKSQPCMHHLMS